MQGLVLANERPKGGFLHLQVSEEAKEAGEKMGAGGRGALAIYQLSVKKVGGGGESAPVSATDSPKIGRIVSKRAASAVPMLPLKVSVTTLAQRWRAL